MPGSKVIPICEKGPWNLVGNVSNDLVPPDRYKRLLEPICPGSLMTYGVTSYIVQNMMTSSNGNIFRITGHLCGEFTGPGEFPAQRPVTRSFDVFFDLSE